MTTTVGMRAGAAVVVRRRWPRLVLFAVAGAVAVLALRGKLPDLGEVAGILGAADPRWTAVAVVAGLCSQFAFADQQRRLLDGFGVRLGAGRAVALTLSRSAMSMALPAGSAVSATFAFRVYRRHGASATVAAAVTAVSGLLSLAALALLAVTGWLVSDPAMIPWGLLGASSVPLLVILWRALRDRIARRWPTLAAAMNGIRELPRRYWIGALRAAVLNWLFDMICLAAAAAACQATLGWGRLALIYLAVQVVRQVPLTPGGVGLIEASMLAGLVAAGMPEATSAAVVLLYRLVSFWLVLPLGLAGWLTLRRPPAMVAAPIPQPG